MQLNTSDEDGDLEGEGVAVPDGNAFEVSDKNLEGMEFNEEADDKVDGDLNGERDRLPAGDRVLECLGLVEGEAKGDRSRTRNKTVWSENILKLAFCSGELPLVLNSIFPPSFSFNYPHCIIRFIPYACLFLLLRQ